MRRKAGKTEARQRRQDRGKAVAPPEKKMQQIK